MSAIKKYRYGNKRMKGEISNLRGPKEARLKVLELAQRGNPYHTSANYL
jgi:hypothetical protein